FFVCFKFSFGKSSPTKSQLLIHQNVTQHLKKIELQEKIRKATSSLIDMAKDMCWNKISENYEYIKSEIDESIGKNSFERAKIRKKVNDKKTAKSLSEIVSELNAIYENLYDINLHIYKSLPNKTIIEIRYFLKTSHTAEFYPTIKNNSPMLHCKVGIPPYFSKHPNSAEKQKIFDVNWELGGIRHELNKFWWEMKYYIDRNLKIRKKKKTLGNTV
ncbi:hypothetical protein, partial [uncultured Polaribacter sp.]|uniref:hypothetical protein n=1 Tax=uncultured Polaribacter sp. TaxID=174711 RepID=UPI002619924D